MSHTEQVVQRSEHNDAGRDVRAELMFDKQTMQVESHDYKLIMWTIYDTFIGSIMGKTTPTFFFPLISSLHTNNIIHIYSYSAFTTAA